MSALESEPRSSRVFGRRLFFPLLPTSLSEPSRIGKEISKRLGYFGYTSRQPPSSASSYPQPLNFRSKTFIIQQSDVVVSL